MYYKIILIFLYYTLVLSNNKVEEACKNLCFLKNKSIYECFLTQTVWTRQNNVTTQFYCEVFLKNSLAQQEISYMSPGGSIDPRNLLPIDDPNRVELLKNVINLFKQKIGFKVEILLNLTSEEPNIWIYPNNIIVVNGGLARFNILDEKGIIVAISYGIATYLATPRHSEVSVSWASCSKDADYYLTYVTRNIWEDEDDQGITNSLLGAAQLEKFMDWVFNPSFAPKPCYQNTSHCRYDIVVAGTELSSMPTCAV